MSDTCPSTPVQGLARLPLPSSPPPNCAICLSDCDNKSFTDRCLHQFCFACLLRWSKVKAECPLCKQPFRSIIHNVRSNNEYEEHVILTQAPQPPEDLPEITVDPILDEHYYLPTGPPPSNQRRFQYRTTFVVEPRDEMAIHRLLLSHPLTNSIHVPHRSRYSRVSPGFRYTSRDFRLAIYQYNWWANPTPDITGRFRDCSPQFFRENPAQIHNITPWLHRELCALLDDNVPHVLYIMSIITDLLKEHHVTAREFKDRIQHFFGDRTDHFLHEFHCFLRSPHDMIGYDNYASYTQRIENIEIPSDSSASDSDDEVRVVGSRRLSQDCVIVAPDTSQPTEVIELSDTDSNDSDVIIREPTPPPLINVSDSDEPARESESAAASQTNNENEAWVEPRSGSVIVKYEHRSYNCKEECASSTDDSNSMFGMNNVESASQRNEVSQTERKSETSDESPYERSLVVRKNHSTDNRKTYSKRKTKRPRESSRKRKKSRYHSRNSDSSSNESPPSQRRGLKRRAGKFSSSSFTMSSSSNSDSSENLFERQKRYRRRNRKHKKSRFSESSTNSDHSFISGTNFFYSKMTGNDSPSTSQCLDSKTRVVNGMRLRSVIVKPNAGRSWYDRPEPSSDDDSD